MDSISAAGQILTLDRPPAEARWAVGEAGIGAEPWSGPGVDGLTQNVGVRRGRGGSKPPGLDSGGGVDLTLAPRLEPLDSSLEVVINGARLVEAPTIAGVALGRPSGADPVAAFLAHPPIRPVANSSSQSSGGSTTEPAAVLGDGLSPGPVGMPGPPGDEGHGEPGRDGEPRIYLTASFRAVVFIMTMLGLLWWKLDRDGN